VHVTSVLFLVLVGNSALTMDFYWSYTLLLQFTVLMRSCCTYQLYALPSIPGADVEKRWGVAVGIFPRELVLSRDYHNPLKLHIIVFGNSSQIPDISLCMTGRYRVFVRVCRRMVHRIVPQV